MKRRRGGGRGEGVAGREGRRIKRKGGGGRGEGEEKREKRSMKVIPKYHLNFSLQRANRL